MCRSKLRLSFKAWCGQQTARRRHHYLKKAKIPSACSQPLWSLYSPALISLDKESSKVFGMNGHTPIRVGVCKFSAYRITDQLEMNLVIRQFGWCMMHTASVEFGVGTESVRGFSNQVPNFNSNAVNQSRVVHYSFHYQIQLPPCYIHISKCLS